MEDQSDESSVRSSTEILDELYGCVQQTAVDTSSGKMETSLPTTTVLRLTALLKRQKRELAQAKELLAVYRELTQVYKTANQYRRANKALLEQLRRQVQSQTESTFTFPTPMETTSTQMEEQTPPTQTLASESSSPTPKENEPLKKRMIFGINDPEVTIHPVHGIAYKFTPDSKINELKTVVDVTDERFRAAVKELGDAIKANLIKQQNF